MSHSRKVLLVLAASALACTAAPSSDPQCIKKLPTDPLTRLSAGRPLCDDGRGSGLFGKWTTDARGLPAYRYTLRHEDSAHALYANSQDDDRRTHWSGFGNDRTSAFAYNHGAVELLSLERGPLSLNKVDPPAGRWGGGLAIVVQGNDAWSTLAWNNEAVRERVFGADGLEVTAGRGGTRLTHRVWAPQGDAPVLRVDIELENTDDFPKYLTVLEVWDVNVEQRFFGLVSPGLTKERSQYNAQFSLAGAWDPAAGRVTLDYVGPGTPDGEPEERSTLYPSIFLADLTGEAAGGYVSRQGVEFDAAGRPTVNLERARAKLALGSAEDAQTTLTLRWEVRLAARATKRLSGVFGYRYPDQPSASDLIADASALSWEENGRLLADRGVYLAAEGAPWLGRETLWHSAMLNVNSMYDSYFGTHVYNQGSTYGYLQGINGAPRDQVLALLPTVYFRPDLAKANLRYLMRTSLSDGKLTYAVLGHGVLTGAGIHEDPSDLDLFFLWGLSEYLLATRDFAFLDEDIAYYDSPVSAGTTVLDHARVAFSRITDTVGIGVHGLMKLRDGDWSDGIILRAADQDAAKQHGESTFNAALAALALPRMAAAVRRADAGFADALDAFAQGQADAFRATWQGAWYLRGYGDVDEPIGDTQIFLEPHAVALLAGIVPEAHQTKLLASIAAKLEDPSPIGQLVVFPADQGNPFLDPGWDVNGGTWHAVNGVLTAAYAGIDAGRAWRSLEKNSMMNHGEQYPSIWYGIWSGADSYNAHYAERPGETFSHFATPMIDFPVLNSNQHAMPLFATLRGYGIAATAEGLMIAPAFSAAPFVLRTPWLRVAGGPADLAVEVTALHPGARWIGVKSPPAATTRQSVREGKVAARVTEGDLTQYLWSPDSTGDKLVVVVPAR